MVPDGQYTATVYLAIKENRYIDAVQLLTFELQVRRCCLEALTYLVSVSTTSPSFRCANIVLSRFCLD
jgi:hypothetical protein